MAFTVVLCSADGCRSDVHEHLTGELRRAVRGSEHGVLVLSGCTLGAVVCGLRGPAPLVAVQPCDVDRRPVRPIVRVGPLRTAADVAEVVTWLRAGRLTPAELPVHLVAAHRGLAAAAGN